MIATLLIVTVVSVGGPHKAKPRPLFGATVSATNPQGRTALLKTNRRGRAYLRLSPGVYSMRAELRPPLSNTPLACSRTRAIRARGQVTRVRLYCSIP